MNPRFFLILLSALGLIAFWLFRQQNHALRSAREHLASLSGAHPASTNLVDRDSSATPAPDAGEAHPELHRLRGQVAVLRRELEEHQHAQAARAFSNDWQLVYSGPRPSDHPGFIHFTNLVRADFSSPDRALQSWHYAFHHQTDEPLDSSRMKEIWDVPDDYDQEPGYNIDMGEGLYGGTGFRIVTQETLASNMVRLIIDYEKDDGSSHRRERILVEKNGRWRVKPARVWRQSNDE